MIFRTLVQLCFSLSCLHLVVPIPGKPTLFEGNDGKELCNNFGLNRELSSYYDADSCKCFTRESLTGPVDVSNYSCTLAKNGDYLYDKTSDGSWATKNLATIVEALKIDTRKDNPQFIMSVQMTTYLKPGDTVVFNGSAPSTENWGFRIYFQRVERSKVVSVPLRIFVSHFNDKVLMVIRRGFNDSQQRWPTLENLPSYLIRVTYNKSGNGFSVQIGNDNIIYPFYDEHTAFINNYFIANNLANAPAAELRSVTLNGQNMLEEEYYTDCMAVGLDFEKYSWHWQSGFRPPSDLWDVPWARLKRIPSAEQDAHGCVHVGSKKLRTFWTNLMKYVICEYGQDCASTTESVIESMTTPTTDATISSATKDVEVTPILSTEEKMTAPTGTSLNSPTAETTSPTEETEIYIPETATPSTLTKVFQAVAKVAQTLGCSAIICTCSAVVGIFLSLRDFSYESSLHMSQELCLIFSHLTILFLWDQVENEILCQIASHITQMLMIALFMFILFESLHNYAILTNIVRSGAWHGFALCQGITWSTAIFCTFLSSVTASRPKWSCWISYDQSSVILLTIFPIIVASLVAIVLTEAAGMDIRSPIYKQNKVQRIAALYNRAGLIILLPLQIGTFFSGSAAVYHFQKNDIYLLFDFSFVIFILLSIGIFLFHCMANPQARALVLHWWANIRKIQFNKENTATTEVTEMNTENQETTISIIKSDEPIPKLFNENRNSPSNLDEPPNYVPEA